MPPKLAAFLVVLLLSGCAVSQKDYARIALTSPLASERREAVQALTDQTLLSDVVQGTSTTGKTSTSATSADAVIYNAAFSKLNQQGLLALGNSTWDINVRHGAVRRLTDQRLLTDIFKNARDTGIRNEALRKLTDQQLLADIAKNNSDAGLRWTAILNLTNQQLLTDIAKNDSEVGVRKAAQRRLDELAKPAKRPK